MKMDAFFAEVIGAAGAEALRHAASRCPALGSVLGPRTVLGWLQLASQWGYEGEIPGNPGSVLTITKSEDGLLSGSLSIGEDVYDYSSASAAQLAATMVVALDGAQPLSKGLRDRDLVGLGKSIDLLLKARTAHLQKAARQETGKDNVGKVAAPQGPEAPEAPQATQAARNQQVAPPPSAGQTKIKLTKAQADSHCSVCDAPSFNKRGEFTGCYCFRHLAKSAASVTTDTGYELTLGPDWKKSSIRVLLDILGAGEQHGR